MGKRKSLGRFLDGGGTSYLSFFMQLFVSLCEMIV